MEIENKIRVYKEDIDEMSAELNQKLGIQDSILKQLKDEFGVDNIKTLESFSKKLEEELKNEDKEIKEMINYIDENYYKR